MSTPLENTVYNWLKLLRIPVSKKLLSEKIITHPEYPSLMCITDTLSGLGIPNGALIIDEAKIVDVGEPVLAFVSANGDNTFLIIKDLNLYVKKNPGFIESWCRVIVLAERPMQAVSRKDTLLSIKEKRLNRLSMGFAGIALISLLPVLYDFRWSSVLFSVTTLAGIGISALIIQKQLGYSSPITNQLCKATGKSDCDAVLQSNGSHLFFGLNWADIGIVYFSSFSLLDILSLITGMHADITGVVSIISVAAMPFTIFSVYYQWRKVRKWCLLCLITVMTLWVQFLILLPGLLRRPLHGNPVRPVLFIAVVFFITSTAWLWLVKPILQRLREVLDKYYPLGRFKRDPEVFIAVLETQRKVDITPFENDLQLGNNAAPIQIMVACGLYCRPCATTHTVLHDLIARRGDIVGVTVRFATDMEKGDNPNALAGIYLLQCWMRADRRSGEGAGSEFARTLLHDWFEWMDMEKFATVYPVSGDEDISLLAMQSSNWSQASGIQFTPTLFINGYELPRFYGVNDLDEFLDAMISHFGTETGTNGPIGMNDAALARYPVLAGIRE